MMKSVLTESGTRTSAHFIEACRQYAIGSPGWVQYSENVLIFIDDRQSSRGSSEASIIAGRILISDHNVRKIEHRRGYTQNTKVLVICLTLVQHWVPRAHIKVCVFMQQSSTRDTDLGP